MFRSCAPIGALFLFSLAGLELGTARGAEAQLSATPPAIGGVTRHIDRIEPLTGKPGTEVRVRATGLPRNTNVFVGLGEMQGCGYEVCAATRTDGRGTLEMTVVVPEWAHWEHYEVVMILDEQYVPIAVSDPFHVQDPRGLVQREGRIETVWPGCPALVTEHGVAYALVGEGVPGLLASQGQELRVEGRIVAGTCTLQNAIEVVDITLVP